MIDRACETNQLCDSIYSWELFALIIYAKVLIYVHII